MSLRIEDTGAALFSSTIPCVKQQSLKPQIGVEFFLYSARKAIFVPSGQRLSSIKKKAFDKGRLTAQQMKMATLVTIFFKAVETRI